MKNIDIDKDNLENIDIDIDINKALLENIDIDKENHENIDIGIDIDKGCCCSEMFRFVLLLLSIFNDFFPPQSAAEVQLPRYWPFVPPTLFTRGVGNLTSCNATHLGLAIKPSVVRTSL